MNINYEMYNLQYLMGIDGNNSNDDVIVLLRLSYFLLMDLTMMMNQIGYSLI